MSISLYKPAPFIQMFAKCIDDTLPRFEPTEWIKEGKIYKVKFFTNALNVSDSTAITITDNSGNEICPSPSMSAFKSERFQLFEIYLN